jgi:hypothetical protein
VTPLVTVLWRRGGADSRVSGLELETGTGNWNWNWNWNWNGMN